MPVAFDSPDAMHSLPLHVSGSSPPGVAGTLPALHSAPQVRKPGQDAGHGYYRGSPPSVRRGQEMWEGALDGPSEMVTTPYTWYLRAALAVDWGCLLH